MPDTTTSLELKSFGAFEIKDEAAGEVAAIVARIGVVDKDGDVFLPGSFPPSAKVKMSSYAHNIIKESATPVGKGTITVENDVAIFRGKFFMSTERGREAFYAVKELGEDGEWSFGFPRNVKTAPMTEEWRTKGARRVIVDGVTPVEASPVFIAAGFGTGTLYAKAAPAEPDPAIEAARLKAEEDATKARAEEERQQLAAKQLAEINASSDRLFKSMPAVAR